MIKDLTHEELRKRFDYDPETGLFFRFKKDKRSISGWFGGCPNNCGHLRIQVAGKLYQAHRLAWLFSYGCWPTGEIDHINGDQADNRLANLRDVTRQVNQQNVRKVTKAKKSCNLLGAFKDGSRWMALIKKNGKQTYLGSFSTPEEAHAAYVGAKRILHEGCTI